MTRWEKKESKDEYETRTPFKHSSSSVLVLVKRYIRICGLRRELAAISAIKGMFVANPVV